LKKQNLLLKNILKNMRIIQEIIMLLMKQVNKKSTKNGVLLSKNLDTKNKFL